MIANDIGTSQEKNTGTEFEMLDVVHQDGGLFKRKVSEIMERKEVWQELKKQSRQEFGEVAKQLMKKSSIYAVSQVGHAESPHRKILWILVLAAGLAGCSYEVHRFVALYFQYPVVINLNVENNWSLEFPAVTVCNINRMSEVFERCVQQNIAIEDCKGEMSVAGFHPLIMSERRRVASCSALMNGLQGDETDYRIQFLESYADMSATRRKELGYQLDDLILNCSYNGRQCALESFTEFQSLKYGNCYTFNRRSNAQDVLTTSVTGVASGLELVLSLDPENYLPVTLSVGARVVVHDPTMDPNPDDQGVNISPGFETTLTLKQTCVRRLPAPYKDKCVDYASSPLVKGKNQRECIVLCIQRHSQDSCSCIDPTLQPLDDHKPCNMTDVTDACCLDAVLVSMAGEQLPCNCPLPCFSTKYDKRISTALWPVNFDIEKPNCKMCSKIEALRLIRTKYARLNVQYSSLDRTVFEQKPMFQESELFSQLGGQMGLWLGLSLVAAFEIVENFIYIVKYVATAIMNRRATASSSAQE